MKLIQFLLLAGNSLLQPVAFALIPVGFDPALPVGPFHPLSIEPSLVLLLLLVCPLPSGQVITI